MKEKRETQLKRLTLPKKIRKRDGTVVPFDLERISIATARAMKASGELNGGKGPEIIAAAVGVDLAHVVKTSKNYLPTVEEVQDLVERQLILHRYARAAKAYILYRDKRAEVRRSQKAVPEKVTQLTRESKKYFRNQLAEFIFYTTYSKWIPEESRRETWIETVERYMSFMRETLHERLTEEEYEEIREYMLEMKTLGSMRLLWSAGPAAQKSNVAAYNCSFIAPTEWQDFGEIAYISMCGTGVGFSVEHQNIERLPFIERQTEEKPLTHVIDDSKEGWADALVLGMKTWASGKDVQFDYSKVRPQGARLVTMGGRASGPGPLRALLDFTREKMLNREGRRLTTTDAHDIICKIGEVVVAGGVRRSALISLSDLDDVAMREAKNGQFYLTNPQRSMANNSAVYTEKPTEKEFLAEWSNLVVSGSGERGIFNRSTLKKQLPVRRWKVLEKDFWTCGTNPCVTNDTWVMTSKGPKQVKNLISIPFEAMVDGKKYHSLGFFKTGDKDVFEIRTSRGFSFRATENHKVLVVEYRSRKTERRAWKEVKDLVPGDKVVLHRHSGMNWGGEGTEAEGWLLGNLLGDGNIERNGKANLDFWGPNREFMMEHARELVHASVETRSDLSGYVAKTGYARVQSTGVGNLAAVFGMGYEHKIVAEEIERASSEFYQGFLRGWFDADGSVQGGHLKGVSVRLSSNSLDNLYRAQRMLARLGVISTIYKNRRTPSFRMLPDGKGGTKSYFCEANHELIVTGENIVTFAARIGFTEPSKKERLAEVLRRYRRAVNQETFDTEVTEVSYVGVFPVYDCQVSKANAFDGNGVYLHNCGEIILKSKQFCNLSEVVARAEDTEDTLLEKVRIATILGTYQSMLTNFKYLSATWKKNCDEERLLGVSITGQWDCKAVRNQNTLRKMKEVAIETNRKYAARFGINASTAITCVKPSGNGSQLFDSSSGMHPRHAKFYIRRVRIERHNPLFAMLRDMGVPAYPEVGSTEETTNTFVLEFPVKAPKSSQYFKDDISAHEFLEYWKMVKENYTEHNPSTTISVGEGEWLEVAHWVYAHWDIIGGLSFLPRSEHVYKLAPYETITEERYNELIKDFPEIDFSKIVLYEYDDTTTGAKEIACVAGTCEIDVPPVQVIDDIKTVAK